jgi:hypothetical protein
LKPFENAYINNSKDSAGLRISFLKKVLLEIYFWFLAQYNLEIQRVVTDKQNS